MALFKRSAAGPKGDIAFAPRLHPEDFKAAFTAAESWGSYSQKRRPESLSAQLDINRGSLALRSIKLRLAAPVNAREVAVKIAEQAIAATFEQDGQTLRVAFSDKIIISADESLALTVL